LKIFRKIIILLSAVFFTACSSCVPSLSNPGDDTSGDEEYSFVTWDTCGHNFGDHPCNFTLKNQNNEDVSLYDFYGDTIVVDLSAMWCGPCGSAASEVQDVKDAYDSEGFTYLTVLIENSAGGDPSIDDCSDWADLYGIKEPVLAGDRSLVGQNPATEWPLTSWPTFYFITDEMVINTSLRGFSSSYIDMLIEDTMSK